MQRLILAFSVGLLAGSISALAHSAEPGPRPYRLTEVDLKQPVIWGAECRQPAGAGLAFGGQDQNAADARPHTRVLGGDAWQSIEPELRAGNPLQSLHDRLWACRQQLKNILAHARSIYFRGLASADQSQAIALEVAPQFPALINRLAAMDAELRTTHADAYQKAQILFVQQHLKQSQQLLPSLASGIEVNELQSLHKAQIHLELAAETFAAEPPPRAMDGGQARLPNDAVGPTSQTLVYDSKTKLYVLFGGDHLDYLTNDTWTFDPAQHRWQQRHPAGAPPPRANHRLEAKGDGTIRLTGGYTYASNTDYVGGQYIDLDDGKWIYDLETNQWTGGELVDADSRTYRSGPFHPDYYLQDAKPDAAQFAAWLADVPANCWVTTDPPRRPRLNRDWGTARIDPDHDLLLRFSGGHSAHGGSDVLHYHFSTNRWELPFPVEFPLGQLYSNTSYPNGFNFNMRPWITGHTYQNYEYDLRSRQMVSVGRPRHTYLYDPTAGDWIGRSVKPEAMQYNGCFYTLTLTATPHGVICWDKNGRIHRYDPARKQWTEIQTSGDKLPGAYVDNSSIAYDARRDRVLMVNTLGYGKPFDGQVWALDLKTNAVRGLEPQGKQFAGRLANIDKLCYDAQHDLLLMGTYIKDAGDRTATPAYDCENNRWITLDLEYSTGERYGNTTRAFPNTRSDALVFDKERKLIWGTDTNSQVYVLRIEMETANAKPLE